MKPFKTLLLAGVCLAALSAKADAQVAVQDNVSIGQEVQQLASEIKAYALQLKQYIGEELSWAVQAQEYATQVQQYATEAAQLLAFVHSPNLGTAMGLLNQAGLGTLMPVSPYAVMGMLNGSAFSGGIPNFAGVLAPMAALGQASYNANHIYSPTDPTWNSQHLVNNGNAIAGTQGTALSSYQTLQTHQQTLPALRDRLTTATTPKDVQDAQAEIELENVWTANQQASLTSLQMAAQTQDAARVQQDNESIAKGIDTFLQQAQGVTGLVLQ